MAKSPTSSPGARRPAADKIGADPIDQLVHLSHLIGQDPRLVQPGGGNTSIKEGDTLLVKGSGTDLSTIGREGFTRLSLSRLAALREADSMSDAEMMRFMASCMVGEGPAPSVETPLHALLPYRVIAHTHDVATMSLTNIRDAEAERLVGELFGGTIVYVPYVRPGFPLAQAVGRMDGRTGGRKDGQADSRTGGRIPDDAIGMALAHHGLVVWGDDAEECHSRLVEVTGRIDEFLVTKRRGRTGGQSDRRTADERRRMAELVLPVIRGALGKPERVILHYDDGDDVLAALSDGRMPELARRGMATPEHLLRAGRLPVWVSFRALRQDSGQAPREIDPANVGSQSLSAEQLVSSIRGQLIAARTEYEEYHRRHASAGERPLDDWAKVVLAPGLGVITAFTDKRNAVTANLCYRAVLETIANAETVDRFQFIPEKDVFEFEHWPLERRKVEEQIAKERATKLLPRHVVVIIGGGSGIGAAAARRFAEEGAHVVVADLDGDMSQGVAAEINGSHREQPALSEAKGGDPVSRLRAIGIAVDVRDDASLDALFRQTVLEFGGLDCLFYTAGIPPRFAPITEIRREDLQRQLEVHYLGAVSAIGRAAAVMRRQGLGGSIVASVSKAALVPGRDAVAYGGSKAALLQALRVAAVELGGDGIRVNAINADQIETPLFLQFVRERAASRGVSEEEQLEVYRSRNLMGATLIPPEAVADLAVLLASDRFRFTTGDILTVDGGLPEAFPR
jgi:rhamnose utilization protein RhaD (predicted bifunctional aldolase and dehydrogenase)/NAD(P)-dependent dehydrogenase (short-subunit alcohol dehydrogenase family)